MNDNIAWENYLVAGAQTMRPVLDQISLLLNIDSPVLIYGATGCGKNHVAETIHKAGNRRDSPFVIVNCGAMSREEIALFSTPMKAPLNPLHQARAGTLFLDEIQDTPPEMQRILIRTLQQAKDSGNPNTPRLLASSSVDLAELLPNGSFREDLYFRLNVFELRLPLLHEREVDIVPLAKHFIDELGIETSFKGKLVGRELSPGMESALTGYDWPGNIRELRNVIERAMIMSPGRIIPPETLGMKLGVAAQNYKLIRDAESESDLSLKKATRKLEEAFIRKALEITNGNRTKAANLLDLSHRALLYKIKSYGVK